MKRLLSIAVLLSLPACGGAPDELEPGEDVGTAEQAIAANTGLGCWINAAPPVRYGDVDVAATDWNTGYMPPGTSCVVEIHLLRSGGYIPGWYPANNPTGTKQTVVAGTAGYIQDLAFHQPGWYMACAQATTSGGNAPYTVGSCSNPTYLP